MNKICMIAAVGKNLELGLGNDLIWKFKNDMKFFVKTTTGHTVVMGDKTYYSIGHPLKNRNNIILSFDKLDIPGTTNINDYKEVFNMDEEVFIIGGAMVYKLFMPYTDVLYLTEINDSEEKADAFFPSFDKNLFTREVLGEDEEQGIKFTYVKYTKKGE